MMSAYVKGVAAVALLALPLQANPTLTRVTPPGGQRGAAVRLVLQGAGLDGKIKIHSQIPGSLTELSADGPARQFLLEIDSEAKPGAYSLAIETASGRTNTWLFSVSTFPEFPESESKRPRAPRNDDVAHAQRVSAPAVVNGTLSEADRDLYKVALKAGERIGLEIEARRLGSAIDPVLSVRSEAGRPVARANDSAGAGGDARLAFRAPAAGMYIVEVRDARFSKQQRNFYRLLAGPLEFAEAIFPLGWQAGQPVEVELSGGTLSAPERVRVDGEQAALPAGRGGLPLPFLRGERPETLEPKGTKRRWLTEGTVVNGRVSRPGEIDSYRLEVRPGEEWMIETQAAVLGTSQLYTLLSLHDQDGHKIASAGDQPPEELLSNISTRAETFGDPAIGLRIPAGVSELRVSVEDLLGRGGPGYGYRLAAQRQPPDFMVRLDDTQINIPQGGTTSISLTMDRRGYDGPVKVIATGLPEGVNVEGGNIPAEFGGMTTQRQSLRGRLMLSAADDAKSGPVSLALHAEGRSADGQVIRRPVRTSKLVTPVAGTGQRPVRIPGKPGAIDAMVAGPHPATIKVLSERSLRLIQGIRHEIRWAYESHATGVQAVTAVNVINSPSVANLRILGGALIKPGDNEGSFEMNTTMGTPEMRFDLVLQARVRHAGANLSIYSEAITVDVVQGYDVQLPETPVAVSLGATFEISGSFSREPEFDSEVELEMINLPVGVTCASSKITGNPETFSLACQATPDVEPGEYSVEVAPKSVLAGRDKEAVPYNIPPVQAVLLVEGGNTTIAGAG